MKTGYKILIISCVILLAGCAVQHKPMTFAEMELRTSKNQCMQEATDMNPEMPNSNNPFWTSYFFMCMNRFGYTDKEINKLWY